MFVFGWVGFVDFCGLCVGVCLWLFCIAGGFACLSWLFCLVVLFWVWWVFVLFVCFCFVCCLLLVLILFGLMVGDCVLCVPVGFRYCLMFVGVLFRF